MFGSFNITQKILLFFAVTALAGSIVLNKVNHNIDLTQKQYAQGTGDAVESYFHSLDSLLEDIDHELLRNPRFEELENRIDHNMVIFRDGNLSYWSDHHYIPQYYELRIASPYRYFENASGKFLARKWAINDSIEVFGVIELYRSYPITNDYLKSDFNRGIFGQQNEINISYSGVEPYTNVLIDGTALFSVQLLRTGVKSIQNGYLSILLVFVALGMILFVLYKKLYSKVWESKFEGSLLIWIAALFLMRYVMLVADFPDNILETGLFGSLYFASSQINPSLGDMLLNSIALLLIAIFIFNHYTKSLLVRKALGARFIRKFLFSLFLGFIFYIAIWYPHVIIQTIYHNSQISLDITESHEINFIRIVCTTIFVISGLILFFMVHVLNRIIFQIFRGRYLVFLAVTILSALLFVAYQWWTSQHYLISVIMGFVFLNIMYHLRIFLQFRRLRYTTLQYMFSIMAVVAMVGAYGIYEFENEREKVNMARFADHFLIRNDNLTEFYLNEANELLKEDVFIATRFYSPFLSKEIIAQKIRQVYLYSFFDQYDIKITLLNKDKEILVGKLTSEEQELIRKPDDFTQYQTDYEGVYFLNKAGRDIVRRYIDIVEIKRRGEITGYILLDLKLKKVIPNDVYFELLIDNRFIQPFLGRNYSYAVYTNNNLTYNSGEYDYDNVIKRDELRLDSEYQHIELTDNEGRIIVVSSEQYDYWRLITNFSTFFIIQVFLLLISVVIYSTVLFYRGVTLNFSTRIQIFFNMALFVPLLIVSIITLGSINNSFREEVNYHHQKKAQTITQNITESLSEFRNGLLNKDEMTNLLMEVSRFADADVNVFSTEGELIATSKSLIYDNNLLSEYINPLAYVEIVEKEKPRWVVEEQVGSLGYNSAYRAVRSFQTGELIGIVSVPFFESEVQLEEQQIEVLSTIINIFTLVFIAFLVISYFVSKGLTFPLRLITRKLGKTTLTGENEPIKWDSDDEIGLMVSEYNTMLKNLEENKRQLSKKEKESAWREIAQQVAHEIKNPLTPMQLTLQHLERNLSKEDAKKPIATLLHHIGTLNDIATSFSSFAKMPIPENRPFELIELINKVVRLHQNLEKVSITTSFEEEEVWVIGDEQLMSRILSNIVLNGAQSINNDKGHVKLNISVSVKPKKVVIEISDDGTGIEKSVGNKIFVPNFTTKVSGSGIGLAIAKHGIEHAGGKIWFESEPGVGSVFYIELLREPK